MSIPFAPHDLKPLQEICNLPTDSWYAVFYLVSKGEHDNEKYEKTFTSAEGGSVWTYASALSYDWKQRGVTTGVYGATTANDGKSAWGDAESMFKRFHELGGPDFSQLASKAHTDKKVADELCKKIQHLDGKAYEWYIQAQLEALCRKGGYIYESVHALESCGIERTPLAIACVFDTALNFGLGGKYCPVSWLKKHGRKDEQKDGEEVLLQFLKFKALVGSKNNHNSCRNNAVNRANMFVKLVRKKDWLLSRKGCEAVVTWTMK